MLSITVKLIGRSSFCFTTNEITYLSNTKNAVATQVLISQERGRPIFIRACFSVREEPLATIVGM